MFRVSFLFFSSKGVYNLINISYSVCFPILTLATQYNKTLMACMGVNLIAKLQCKVFMLWKLFQGTNNLLELKSTIM